MLHLMCIEQAAALHLGQKVVEKVVFLANVLVAW